MEIDFVDPLAGSEWDSLVSQLPEATIFHTSAWARVLSRTYGHTPFYMRMSSHGHARALLPIMEVRSWVTGCRGVCLPFTDFCTPLIFGNTEPDALMDAVTALAARRGWKYFELRSSDVTHVQCNRGTQFYVHTLDLRSSLDALFAGFESSVRRAVRKAVKSGLTAEVSSTSQAMAQFYALHVRTRRRHGLPPQPFSFFQMILEEIIRAGLGFIVSVQSASRDVAAAIFLRLGNRAIYKFGASDERLQDLRGNNLAMWTAIQRLVAEGCHTLSLGRSELGSETLRRFKLGWGAEEQLVSYTTCGIMNRTIASRHTTTGPHNTLFRHLPLTINRLAGAFVYPHLD